MDGTHRRARDRCVATTVARSTEPTASCGCSGPRRAARYVWISRRDDELGLAARPVCMAPGRVRQASGRRALGAKPRRSKVSRRRSPPREGVGAAGNAARHRGRQPRGGRSTLGAGRSTSLPAQGIDEPVEVFRARVVTRCALQAPADAKVVRVVQMGDLWQPCDGSAPLPAEGTRSSAAGRDAGHRGPFDAGHAARHALGPGGIARHALRSLWSRLVGDWPGGCGLRLSMRHARRIQSAAGRPRRPA